MKTLFVAFALIALVQFSVAAPVEDSQAQQELVQGFPLEQAMAQLPEEQRLFLGSLLSTAARLAPGAIRAAPGILGGVADIVRASRAQQELTQDQELFLGSLLGAGLSALPGVLQGVGSIVGAARGREEQEMFFGSLLGAGLSALPGVLNGVGGIINAAKRTQQQELFIGSLLGAGLSALPGILGGVSSIVGAAKGRQEEQLWGFSAGGNIGGFGGGFGFNGLQEAMKQMNPKEQEMIFGLLAGLLPSVIGGIASAASRRQQQELGWGSLLGAGLGALPGVLQGVSGIVGAARGREEQLRMSTSEFKRRMNNEAKRRGDPKINWGQEQELFLGQLFGAGLSALPGILGGVSSIVRSARTQEEQLFLGSLLGAGLSALPGVLQGVGSIVGAARGREEQDMFLGSLLGAGLSALPGVLNGVGGIIGAARGREQEMYTFSSKANEKAYKSIAGKVSNYVKRRRGREEQDMGWGALIPVAIGAAPGILDGTANVIRAVRGREQDMGWGALIPVAIGAAPGILDGTANVIRAVRGREQDLYSWNRETANREIASYKREVARQKALNRAARGREQEMGWGNLFSAGMGALPGVLQGVSGIVSAARGRQQALAQSPEQQNLGWGFGGGFSTPFGGFNLGANGMAQQTLNQGSVQDLLARNVAQQDLLQYIGARNWTPIRIAN